MSADRGCALYRHFTADGTLLYVGISLSALNRLGQHRQNAEWFDKIARVEIEHFPTRAAAQGNFPERAAVDDVVRFGDPNGGCVYTTAVKGRRVSTFDSGPAARKNDGVRGGGAGRDDI